MEHDTNIDKVAESSELQAMRDYIETPVHEETMKFILASIPKRLLGMISKALGIKMLLFATASSLFIMYPDQFPWYAWVIVYVITLFGRDGIKFIREIKR